MAWAALLVDHGWVVDTCAGGTFSDDVTQAVEYSTPGEAVAALHGAELIPQDARVRITACAWLEADGVPRWGVFRIR